MTQPILLVPGLNCTAEVYASQLPALWRHGHVTIANHVRGDTMAEIAASILADAPPRFALAGFSMGGYIAFEIMRQAAERVARLALIDTSARPDTPEQSARRRAQVKLAAAGKFGLVVSQQYPNTVHPDHATSEILRAFHTRMAMALGPRTYARHQHAIIDRPDSRSDLAAITCPTLIVVGEADQITPPDVAREMAMGISGSQLATIALAGHLSLLEQPERVTAALMGWLS